MVIPYIRYLEQVLELRRFDRYTAHINEVPEDYKNVSYQIEFFNHLFPNKKSNIDNILNYSANNSVKDLNSSPGDSLSLNIVQQRNELIIAELGLDRMVYGRISYVILMQYCYSHNSAIISRLSKPNLEWLDLNKHLILTHNAIKQLDII